jgi:hypothetical protein
MAGKRQEQTDRADAMLSLVRLILESHPAPPRHFAWPQLILRSYRGKLFPLLLLTGTGSALFVITFFQSGSALTLWFLRLLTGGGALFFLLAPAQNGMTVVRWVRDGVLASADVIEIHLGRDERGDEWGRGRRLVHHPALGDFRDEFSVTGPWISSVTPGAKLQTLVAPAKRETWLTLGPFKGHS